MERANSEPSTTIRLKRAYAPPENDDGARVLVDRLWIRGIAKTDARLDAWMAALGPSADLRTWFGHQSDRWPEFVEKYRIELETPMRRLLLAALQGVVAVETLTLIYGARDEQKNEAVVIRDRLQQGPVKPPEAWDASASILVLTAAVAAANSDAIASRPALRRFTSSLLTEVETDDALSIVAADGRLREVPDGWSVTTSGRQHIRRMENPEPTERMTK
jgi:uncharacterized protein YeaO (DUF488 family)